MNRTTVVHVNDPAGYDVSIMVMLVCPVCGYERIGQLNAASLELFADQVMIRVGDP